MAACVHPWAAWRRTDRATRLRICGGYFLIGFVTVLAALTLLA